MLRFVEHRVGDQRLMSLIRRWLNRLTVNQRPKSPVRENLHAGFCGSRGRVTACGHPVAVRENRSYRDTLRSAHVPICHSFALATISLFAGHAPSDIVRVSGGEGICILCMARLPGKWPTDAPRPPETDHAPSLTIRCKKQFCRR